MESQRSILIIAIAFISFLLWQKWHEAYGPQPVQPVTQEATESVPAGVPSASSVPASNGTDEDDIIVVGKTGADALSNDEVFVTLEKLWKKLEKRCTTG